MNFSTDNRTARTAGLIYVIMAISGAFSILYVPSVLIVPGDPHITYENIVASKFLFRFGVLSGLLSNLLFLVLPLLLFKLLQSVDKTIATLMVAFVLISIPVSLMAQVHQFDVLALISSPELVGLADETQIRAQVQTSLSTYHNGIFTATLFWGLWLLPFGYLVFKSGFLPKILGIFLMIGCFGYIIEFVGLTLWPVSYQASGITDFIHFPSAIGEIGIAFWMLIAGIQKK